MLDMIVQNRHAHSLEPHEVRYIRSMRGLLSSRTLAETYSVTRSAISAIWNRRTWRHLQ